MVHVRSDRAEVWYRSGPGSISMSSPVAELHLSDRVHLSGIRPIDLVSVDLVAEIRHRTQLYTISAGETERYVSRALLCQVLGSTQPPLFI